MRCERIRRGGYLTRGFWLTSSTTRLSRADGTPLGLGQCCRCDWTEHQYLTSRQVLSVAAPATGAGRVSTNVLLTGNAENRVCLHVSDLHTLRATIPWNGRRTLALALWDFLGANRTHEFHDIFWRKARIVQTLLCSLADGIRWRERHWIWLHMRIRRAISRPIALREL